jgi:ketosteroid isomerase-like protein
MATPESKAEIVKRFLTQTRSMDEFISYFSEDAEYVFANNPPIVGRKPIQESSTQFRKRLKGAVHEIENLWELGDTVICEMNITYTRLDGQTLTLPCTDVIEMEGPLFKRLQAFMDITPVFAT